MRAPKHHTHSSATVPISQIVSPVAPISFVADPVAPAPTPAPAPDPIILVTGTNQVVSLTDATNTTVIDQGTSTTIELTGACQITVQDFATDHTARLIFENQGLLAQTVTNDGTGGTLVRCGSASVDFAGVVLDARHQVLYTSSGANQMLAVFSR